jgi:multiple antibiotic resistance protein
MLFFSFLGEWLINLLSLSMVTVYITSGVILFLTAIKILFSQEERFPAKHGEEPFLVPLAIPIIAGPALLATIMLFSSTEEAVSTMFTAILFAWGITSALLLNSRLVVKVLGPSGLIACERLMGMVLVLISIQRMAAGALLFINDYK